VIGVSELEGEGFPVRRTFHTGSWLVRAVLFGLPDA
jgi:hypothetical protein